MKLRTLVLALAAAAAVTFLAIRPRLADARALAARTAGANRQIVTVTVARRSDAFRELILPASLQPLVDTAIYARTSGYIGAWYTDIGARVREGQVLAKIEAPELDQQLNQARAALDQARANLELARISANRWQELGRQNAVAQQDVDQRTADYAARRADVRAAQANVDRLEQLQEFERVTAPFDGTISARNIDTGTLINAGTGPELFHLTQSGTLRVYLDVPQSYVPDIHEGLQADVLVAEYPSKAFPGRVARFAGALDASSRTLRTEVQIPNPGGELLPGMFCRVRFRLKPASPPILIPSDDAIIRAEGTLVAEVTPAGTIHLQPVKLGRDFGTQIEVLDGLAEGTRVVENPSDALAEGQEVGVDQAAPGSE
jgi:RND family efflux transporter MFP subunit